MRTLTHTVIRLHPFRTNNIMHPLFTVSSCPPRTRSAAHRCVIRCALCFPCVSAHSRLANKQLRCGGGGALGLHAFTYVCVCVCTCSTWNEHEHTGLNAQQWYMFNTTTHGNTLTLPQCHPLQTSVEGDGGVRMRACVFLLKIHGNTTNQFTHLTE